MKKKTKTSPIESLRKESAYPAVRAFFGIPFYLAGSVMLLIAARCVPLAIDGDSPITTFGIVAMIAIAGLFTLSIPALAGALLDIADASIRNDAREAQRDARQAYEDYKGSQAPVSRIA